MAQRTLTLSSQTPRSLTSFEGKIDPREGLRVGLYGAVPFFVFSALSIIGAVLLPLPDTGIRIFLATAGTLLFATIGMLFYVPARSRLGSRVDALMNGHIVKGRVISQGRAFVAWKSWQDYTLCATFETPKGERNYIIQSSDERLHQDFPVDGKISALYVNESELLFCPAEMGFELTED